MEDVITLISVGDREFDSWGIPQESSYKRRQVLCDVRSAGRSEFYQAANAGLKPELVLVLANFADYQGERVVVFEGKEYTVLRTYRRPDRDRLELTLEERVENGA